MYVFLNHFKVQGSSRNFCYGGGQKLTSFNLVHIEEDERREKKEEKTTVSSSKALFRFSSPIGSFYRIGI